MTNYRVMGVVTVKWPICNFWALVLSFDDLNGRTAFLIWCADYFRQGFVRDHVTS